MQATKQQQIMGYFIEEAKEHLDTIEQGLLDLQDTMADSERLNEMFRAAHSVKGGAAMLGFDSIHRVGHHLEDCFKILKDNPMKVDQQLENLFLQGFDALKDLVEGLQSPYGLRQEDAEQVVKAAEPAFTELQTYLNRCLQGDCAVTSQPPLTVQPAPQVVANLATHLNSALKLMLQLFKQGDTPTGRQQLTTLCTRMLQLSSSRHWRELLQVAQTAIGNSQNSYQALAPLIIKELKQAGDLLLSSRFSEITPSRSLLQLAAVKTAVVIPQSAVPQPTPKPAPQPIQSEHGSRSQSIMIPAEPRSAARALLNAFNKEQLIELAEFLMKAIQ